MKWPHICSNVDLLYCNKNEQSKTEFPQLLLLVPFIISSLSGGGKGIEAAFSKKVASSTDDEMVEAKYIGANDESEATESFDIEVRSLAEPQVNQSNFLYSGVRDIPVGNFPYFPSLKQD